MFDPLLAIIIAVFALSVMAALASAFFFGRASAFRQIRKEFPEL